MPNSKALSDLAQKTLPKDLSIDKYIRMAKNCYAEYESLISKNKLDTKPDSKRNTDSNNKNNFSIQEEAFIRYIQAFIIVVDLIPSSPAFILLVDTPDDTLYKQYHDIRSKISLNKHIDKLKEYIDFQALKATKKQTQNSKQQPQPPLPQQPSQISLNGDISKPGYSLQNDSTSSISNNINDQNNLHNSSVTNNSNHSSLTDINMSTENLEIDLLKKRFQNLRRTTSVSTTSKENSSSSQLSVNSNPHSLNSSFSSSQKLLPHVPDSHLSNSSLNVNSNNINNDTNTNNENNHKNNDRNNDYEKEKEKEKENENKNENENDVNNIINNNPMPDVIYSKPGISNMPLNTSSEIVYSTPVSNTSQPDILTAPEQHQKPSIFFPKTSLLDAETLEKYLNICPSNILLIDVRSRDEFDTAHIKTQNVICIEPLILKPNLSDLDIEDSLIVSPEYEQELFSRRAEFELVVYYNQNAWALTSSLDPTNPDRVLLFLSDSLYKKSPIRKLKRPPCLLIGGLDAWIEQYGNDKIEASPTIVSSAASSMSSQNSFTVSSSNSSLNLHDVSTIDSIASITTRRAAAEKIYSSALDPKIIDNKNFDHSNNSENSINDQNLQNNDAEKPELSKRGRMLNHLGFNSHKYLKGKSNNNNSSSSNNHIPDKSSNSSSKLQSSNPSSSTDLVTNTTQYPISQPQINISKRELSPRKPAPINTNTSTHSHSIFPKDINEYFRQIPLTPPPQSMQFARKNYLLSLRNRSTHFSHSIPEQQNSHVIPRASTPNPQGSVQPQHISNGNMPNVYYNNSSYDYHPSSSAPFPPSNVDNYSHNQHFNSLANPGALMVPHPSNSSLPYHSHISGSRTPPPSMESTINPHGQPRIGPNSSLSNNVRNNLPVYGSGIVGLKNLGNTCYMNSIVQCLAGCTPLAQIFLSNRFREYINMENRMGTKGALAEAFANVIKELYNDHNRYVIPETLKRLSGKMREDFSGYDQQDAQEFLMFILDGLHEDLNVNGHLPRLKELSLQEERAREKMTVRYASFLEWQRYLKSSQSIIVDIFQGQYQSRLKCMTCSFTSTTYNPFEFLTLPVPVKRRKVSLKECFSAFVAKEVLDKEDGWNCPNCKVKRKATKSLTLSRLPNVLIIHLKRFKVSGGQRSEKIDTMVDYPISNLDLTSYWPPYLPEDEKWMKDMHIHSQVPPFIYSLFAVTLHHGTATGGHYTAYVQKPGRGWWLFDDTQVRPVRDGIVNSNAYVLFYVRQRNSQHK